jgi:hypothetical protein
MTSNTVSTAAPVSGALDPRAPDLQRAFTVDATGRAHIASGMQAFFLCSLEMSTVNGYASHLRRILKQGHALDAGGFVSFLTDRKTKVSPTTARQMYAAVKLYLQLTGEPIPQIAADLVRRALNAYNAGVLDSRPPTKVYGTLNAQLLMGLRELPIEERKRYFPVSDCFIGLFWQYTFALRTAEVGRITRGDVSLQGGRYVLKVGRAKHLRDSQRTVVSETEWHVGSTRFNIDIAWALQHTTLEGTVLFPNWKQLAVNDGLRYFSRAQKWDPAFKWTSHAIRYGSAADARAEAEAELQGTPADDVYQAVLERVSQRTGHMDKAMSGWYMRDASARAQAHERPFHVHQERIARAAAADASRGRGRGRGGRAAARGRQTAGVRRDRSDDDDDDDASESADDSDSTSDAED